METINKKILVTGSAGFIGSAFVLRPHQSQTKTRLGTRITLDEMVREMVASDLADAKKHALLKHHGYQVAVSAE